MTLATWKSEKMFGPLEVGIDKKNLFDSNSTKTSALFNI